MNSLSITDLIEFSSINKLSFGQNTELPVAICHPVSNNTNYQIILSTKCTSRYKIVDTDEA